MQNLTLETIGQLTDTDLVRRVKSLVGSDRRVTSDLVAHLAVLDTRDIHLREGYSSLFAYCRDCLGLSDAELLREHLAQDAPELVDIHVDVDLLGKRGFEGKLRGRGRAASARSSLRRKSESDIRAMAARTFSVR